MSVLYIKFITLASYVRIQEQTKHSLILDLFCDIVGPLLYVKLNVHPSVIRAHLMRSTFVLEMLNFAAEGLVATMSVL